MRGIRAGGLGAVRRPVGPRRTAARYLPVRSYGGVSPRIGQVTVTVKDLERAVAFYRDALGMRLLFRAPGMAFLECGGTRVLLGTENATGQAVLLYYFVDDITAAHARLAAAGAAFEEAPHLVAKLADRDVWLAAFRDAEGVVHHLMSEVARASAPA